MDDWDGLLQAAIRDRATFGRFVAAIQDVVRLCAMQILRNYHDAEDATQMAILNIYQHLGTYRQENLRAWVCQIAANAARDLARQKWRRKEQQGPGGCSGEGNLLAADKKADNPASVVEYDELLAGVWREMEQWPEQNRRVGELFLKGWDYHRIADELNIAPSNVASRLTAVRERIRRFLGGNGGGRIDRRDPE